MSLMSIEPPMPNQNRVTETCAKLSLTSAELSVDASCGLARVRLVQEFQNQNSEPLSVTYKLPLPADAAVGGFAFVIGDRRIVGHIDGRKEARETFERAVIEGKSAALLEQDRSSLFTQEIGNIPPGATVRAEIDIDQPLTWLSEGSWEWRFPLAAAPRYLGSGPIEGDVGIETALADIGARASLSMTIRDLIAEGRSPESPSHPLVTNRVGGSFKIELGSGNKVELDRDVVLRWPAAGSAAVAAIDVARPGVAALSASAYGLLTIVPPAPDAKQPKVARDLTLLIDTSGSMSGEPLAQAKRVCCALVDSLEIGDQLEMIEFSYTSTSFERAPRAVDAALKKRAIAWIQALDASGGTEMLSGVKHAMRDLRAGSQRQVILITDGLVGFEREIVTTLLAELPRSARLHALGVGSAVNRSLLAPIARAGRGIEAIVGLGEDPERAAARLLSRTVAPAVVDLVIEGSAFRRVVPSALGDAYAGAPLRAAIELDPAGGELVVRGRTAEGAFVRSLRVLPTSPGEGSEAVVKLYGRELVEDLEMRLSAGEAASVIDAEIEETGKRFAILTRHTSWVATTPEATVDPRDPTRKLVQPQALPYGMRAQSVGRAYAAAPPGMPMGMAAPGMGAPPGMGGFGGPPPRPMVTPGGFAIRSRAMKDSLTRSAPAPQSEKRDEGRTAAAPPPPPARSPAPAPWREEKKEAEERDEERAAAPIRVEAPLGKKPTYYQQVGQKLKKALGLVKPLFGRLGITPDAFVIELTVPTEGLELAYAGANVTLILEDGSETSAAIIVERSTREGAHAGGLTVRVVLENGAGLNAEVRTARIELANGAVIEASI